MSKSIVIRWKGNESSFSFSKLERDKLYDKRQKVVVDEHGNKVSTAFLTQDGAALVPLGGTASVYSDALWNAVEAEERLAVADDGAELPVLPSTLGVASEAQEVDANRILDCAIDSVYQLSADAMDADLQAAMIGGALFETSFSYRGGSSYDPLFLLHNEHGFFALVGRETRFSFLEHEVPASDDSADELDDELDFSMT